MIAQSQAQSMATADAKNLLECLLINARAKPDKAAAKSKVAGQWKDHSWSQVLDRVRKGAAGLTAMGVKPGDKVALFSATRYEWALANFAIYGAGAICIPIYASNTPEEIEHILKDSGATALILDGDIGENRTTGRWTRLKQVLPQHPAVAFCAGFEMASKPEEKLYSWAEVEAKGEPELAKNPKQIEEMAAKLQPDDLAFIMYTSGTTGKAKGVMLTQKNWTYQAWACVSTGLLREDDTCLLFLPLAHSFAQVVISAWLGAGFVLAFAESVEKAVDNCAEVRATVMPAVPRVFEKIFNKVVTDAGGAPGLKGKLFQWAMKLFEEYAQAKNEGREYSSLQWTLAKKLVFSKLQEKLAARVGGRMREFISGSAPLSRKIAYFFDLAGLYIAEGYGLTETSAPTHANKPTATKIGTVGQPFPQTEVKIAEDGEILVRGPQIMKGYYNLPEETKAVLEADGWFHTGDIGEEDGQRFLRITDRKKDLIKTSGGKYIAPQELENALKTEPFISQVMIHGDRRKYVSALVTVNEENIRKWAKDHGVGDGDYKALTQRPEIRARIQAAVDALNAQQPSYATVKKFTILDHDWSQDTGELTPTLKVKRKIVTTKYKAQLDGMYDGESFD